VAFGGGGGQCLSKNSNKEDNTLPKDFFVCFASRIIVIRVQGDQMFLYKNTNGLKIVQYCPYFVRCKTNFTNFP
jgi:hypothetical protein